MKIIKVVSWMLMLALSGVSYASVDRAMEYYQQGNYEQAYSLFKSYAEIGNAGAQFNIGVMHYKGQLVEKNWPKAYAWMALAAETGSIEQHINLSKKVFAKFSPEKKKLATKELDKLREELGRDAILAFVKPILLADEDCSYGVEKIHHVQAKYPKDQLRQGKIGIVELEYTIWHDGSVRDVKVISSTHEQFTKNSVEAVLQWKYKPPLENGKPAVIYNHRLSSRFVLANSKGDIDKITKFLNQLKAGAESGSPVHQYQYADGLSKTTQFAKSMPGFEYQDQDSNQWFYKAAENGIAEAQYRIGRNQFYGQGCAQNKEAGVRWLLKAATQGLPESQYLLAIEFLKDPNLVYHEDESIMWLEEANLRNYGPARAKLAWVYATAKEERFFAPEKAAALLKQDIDGYYDEAFILEAKAASYAANGKFKKAKRYQKKAISEAEDYGRDLTVMEERLVAYKAGKAWRQSIHQL